MSSITGLLRLNAQELKQINAAMRRDALKKAREQRESNLMHMRNLPQHSGQSAKFSVVCRAA